MKALVSREDTIAI